MQLNRDRVCVNWIWGLKLKLDLRPAFTDPAVRDSLQLAGHRPELKRVLNPREQTKMCEILRHSIFAQVHKASSISLGLVAKHVDAEHCVVLLKAFR